MCKVRGVVAGNAFGIISPEGITLKVFKINGDFQKKIVAFLNDNRIRLENKAQFSWATKLKH